MNSNLTFQLLFSIPWGNKSNEIPVALEEYPPFAFVLPEQMRSIRAPLRVRLDVRGDLHVLTDAYLRTPNSDPLFVHHVDARGDIVGKTRIPSDVDELIISDYVVDANGSYYLLERVRSRDSNEQVNRLRKISNDGEVRWSRTGPISDEEFDFRELKGTFKQLLIDGRSRLYLPATEHDGAIAEINRDTGDVAQIYRFGQSGSKVFLNERGVVFYILYFPDLNRRGFGSFNLEDQSFQSFVGDDELYGWLLYPIGVDASSNFYVWRDSTVARISFDGQISVIAEFDNVVARSSDQAIFSSRIRVEDERPPIVQVDRHSPDAGSSHSDLRIPEEFSAGQGWRLIHVDDEGQYYVHGGEEPGQMGWLLVYDSNGNFREKLSPPLDLLALESSLEGHSFWQIDSSGRIYLPVTDAHGFKVVRLIGED